MSRLLIRTLRDTPSDADLAGHQLLVRAGFIRRGTLLPLGLRVARKIEAIARDELAALDAQEVLFGHPDNLAESIRSDKQLPLLAFQLSGKSCAEDRPRLGLLRANAYLALEVRSFAATGASRHAIVCDIIDRILERCDLPTRRIDALGGHAWLWAGDEATGETEVLACPTCGYAADGTAADSRPIAVPVEAPGTRRKAPTPGIRTVAEQAAMLNLPTSRIVKTLVVNASEPVVALVRGDSQVNLAKLARHLGCTAVRPATDEEVLARTGVRPGFVGPFSLPAGLRVVADESLRDLGNFSTGAGEVDTHWVDANWGDDGFVPAEWADIRQAEAGQACPRCPAGRLESGRGTVLAEAKGDAYGLGITRTLQTVVEAHHDADGIKWPTAIAPYHMVIVPANPQDAEIMGAATELYAGLMALGVETVLDDRDERAGVKFKDADLIGFPLRITVGKALKEGKVALKIRRTGELSEIALSEAIPYVKRLVAGSAASAPVLKA